MIKIVSYKICPFVQRVTALLEAKNIPYEIEFISLSNKPRWFLDIAPNGQVPVLITESGTALFESDAIVEYIDEVTNPLEADVSAEQRAIDRAWSYQAAKHYLVQCSAMRSISEETLQERAENLGKAFAKAERYLTRFAGGSDKTESGSYFKGASLSNVDIAWLPLLHRAAIIEQYTRYDFLANYPNVKNWQKALLGTGLAEKSVSEDFEQVFTEFYLSEKTYLGNDKKYSCTTVGQSSVESCSTESCC
ncbi:glutathione S-transferase family protein [Litoribacillus peritrichatus]|uniref:Glutathione S-transferase family protein n=1 Tax=Litoribacillus peritrichatus TaxID=718191 RepID=A0ABP7MTK4_9GAMM